MSPIFQKMLSRKLLFGAGIVALSFIALMCGKIGGSEWVAIVTLTAGIYTYGNGADKKAAQQVDKG